MPPRCLRCSRWALPPRSAAGGATHRCSGFLLPLASLLSLLLLLSSLSVQAVSLQGRLRGETELRLQEAEDRLGSAAQVLLGRVQQSHPCLLGLPLDHWGSATCLSGPERAALMGGELLGAHWQLLRWQPAAIEGNPAVAPPPLRLEIALAPGPGRAALRAGFEVRLAGAPWRVQELRRLGLRGS